MVLDVGGVEHAVFVLGREPEDAPEALLAGAVHVVDVDARELARQLGRGEQLQLLEQLVHRLALPAVARGVDEEPERAVPQPAGDLEVAVDQSVVVDRLGVDVPQDDADDGQSVLALAAVVDGTGREERLGAAEGIAEHEVLEPGVRRRAVLRDLRPVPRHGQRRRAQVHDEIPHGLEHRRPASSRLGRRADELLPLLGGQPLADLVPVLVQEPVERDTRTKIKRLAPGSILEVCRRDLRKPVSSTQPTPPPPSRGDGNSPRTEISRKKVVTL